MTLLVYKKVIGKQHKSREEMVNTVKEEKVINSSLCIYDIEFGCDWKLSRALCTLS